MSTAVTFVDRKLLKSDLVGATGAVEYTTSTTSSYLWGRKVTTITAAGGLVGLINWREKTFIIDGVQRRWDQLKSRPGGIFSSSREWNWGHRPYKLKYRDSHKELLATPTFGAADGTVRFTTYRHHLFVDNERAAVYFPLQMQDEDHEIERMFLLMSILKTETDREDASRRRHNGAARAAASGM
ncbi:hypothetical protein DFH07DRAFT_960017 [Mycena maculata]|uniref:Uncharacterized protein n=1 Tax=Mycena maculata TaxID=230809 RepID=A0AAD7J1D8_9AGAR|nr:hypothetical protein DFH07DRAFT_960017 [Mycena maculata]